MVTPDVIMMGLWFTGFLSSTIKFWLGVREDKRIYNRTPDGGFEQVLLLHFFFLVFGIMGFIFLLIGIYLKLRGKEQWD